MKEIYELNQMEIERQNDLIKKYEYEKEKLMNRVSRLNSIIDRKKNIVNKKEIENKFMIKHDLV
jgi:hypothetical protein